MVLRNLFIRQFSFLHAGRELECLNGIWGSHMNTKTITVHKQRILKTKEERTDFIGTFKIWQIHIYGEWELKNGATFKSQREKWGKHKRTGVIDRRYTSWQLQTAGIALPLSLTLSLAFTDTSLVSGVRARLVLTSLLMVYWWSERSKRSTFRLAVSLAAYGSSPKRSAAVFKRRIYESHFVEGRRNVSY